MSGFRGVKSVVSCKTFVGTDGKRHKFYESHIVQGTSGLLAVTKEADWASWVITHVPSRMMFPGSFTTRAMAEEKARAIWEKYPRRQLKCKTKRGVVRGMDSEKVVRMFWSQ